MFFAHLEVNQSYNAAAGVASRPKTGHFYLAENRTFLLGVHREFSESNAPPFNGHDGQNALLSFAWTIYEVEQQASAVRQLARMARESRAAVGHETQHTAQLILINCSRTSSSPLGRWRSGASLSKPPGLAVWAEVRWLPLPGAVRLVSRKGNT